MISKINNKKITISREIYSIFQTSYKVEAKILKATNFPPLKRTVADFLKCNNIFYAYHIHKNIVGVIEIDNDISVHIQSLVVSPKHFRKGIGKSLIQFTLEKYKNKNFTVETGLANQPAVNLYIKFNFKEISRWDTEHNVRKIKLKRNTKKVN